MNYKMVRAEDGIVWVTLQPLLTDVKQALENAKNIKTENMTDEEKRGVDFTILAMESVYNFITSLLTEQNVNELVKNATPDVTPTVTHDGTLH
jgi:hypothetical protein